MDKSRAKEILGGDETTNDLKRQGTLISNPNVVVTLVIDGSESTMAYGSNGLTQSDLDYLVHRDKGVTLGEKTDYYKMNKVIARTFTLENGSITVTEYEADPVNGWSET